MDDEQLKRLLVMLSDLIHEVRSVADRLTILAETIKDIERPGWRGR